MRIILVFTAFVLLFSVQGAAASTIYVPDDYESIQGAVDHANKGDTIVVRDGVYRENVNVTKQLVIRSENGSSDCIVFGVGVDEFAPSVFRLSADGVTVKGFTITSSGEHKGVNIRSDNNEVKRNYITNNSVGVNLGLTSWVCEVQGAENNVITGNTITDNYQSIAYVSTNNEITGNNISDNEHGRMPISPPTPYPCDTQETNPDKRATESTNETPGFKALFMIAGFVAAYLMRRLQNE